jgi:hypothetical protein
MKKIITICLVCVLSTSVTVLADDINSPWWRGEVAAHYAEYDNWTGFPSSLPSPDSWMNEYPPCSFYGDCNLLSVFQGRTNVIKLTGDFSDISLIDMRSHTPDTIHRDLRIQVTYYPVDTNQYPNIGFITGSLWGNEYELITGPFLVNSMTAVDGWRTEVWDCGVISVPVPEVWGYYPLTDEFSVGFSMRPAYIDQIVFDSVPEPATIGLLGLGGLVVFRRRK